MVSSAMEWLTLVRSGDDGLPFLGKRVGRVGPRSEGEVRRVGRGA